jgi:hypothetical protein
MQTEERQSAERILEAWRSAERELAAQIEGTPEYEAGCAAVQRLASSYHEEVRRVSESSSHARAGEITSMPQLTEATETAPS